MTYDIGSHMNPRKKGGSRLEVLVISHDFGYDLLYRYTLKSLLRDDPCTRSVNSNWEGQCAPHQWFATTLRFVSFCSLFPKLVPALWNHSLGLGVTPMLPPGSGTHQMDQSSPVPVSEKGWHLWHVLGLSAGFHGELCSALAFPAHQLQKKKVCSGIFGPVLPCAPIPSAFAKSNVLTGVFHQSLTPPQGSGPKKPNGLSSFTNIDGFSKFSAIWVWDLSERGRSCCM